MGLALKVAEGSRALLSIVRAYGSRYGRDWSREVEEATDKLDKAIEEVKKPREKAKLGFKLIGRELFEERLKLNLIPETPEQLRRHGYQEAEKYRSIMVEVANSMGVSNVKEALEKIEQKKPSSPGEVFEMYKKALEKARNFVVKEELVDLPIGEYVEVIETPPHLKPYMPFAGYIPPEVFHYSNTGLHLVTKPESEEMLSHFNWYDILSTAVHEAYPGHHVQLCYTKNAPTLLRKTYFQPPEFIEGWAHYAEWLAVEEGIDTSLEYRLKVLHDALTRSYS